ncbi:hypothetical protein BN128_916 [Cronobacter sakazakii 696]|nr:hypothetical protein BN128_916 [Cronobacter sakazakii 696]
MREPAPARESQRQPARSSRSNSQASATPSTARISSRRLTVLSMSR